MIDILPQCLSSPIGQSHVAAVPSYSNKAGLANIRIQCQLPEFFGVFEKVRPPTHAVIPAQAGMTVLDWSDSDYSVPLTGTAVR